MAQPQNAAIIDQAGALNALIDKKSFSWTLAMEDLETVLPGGVQVTTLEPIVDKKDGHVAVHMRVVGPRDKAVDLVANLEHSRRFLQPRIIGESAEATNNANPNQQLEPVSASNRENFDLLADYNPATAAEQEAARKNRHAEQGAEADQNLPAPRTNRAAPAHGMRPNPSRPSASATSPAGRVPSLPTRSRRVRNDGQTTTWREHLTSPLTWHYAGFAILLVAAIAMGTRFGLDWAAISAHTHDTILDRQIRLHALKAQTEPLRGLDKRLVTTSDEIKTFYAPASPLTTPPSPPRSGISWWLQASASPASAIRSARRPTT